MPRHDPFPGGTPDVLIIDASEPAPDRDSGSLRLVNLMRLLAGRGRQIAFIPDDLRITATGQAVLRDSGVLAPPIASPSAALAWLEQAAPSLVAIILCRHHVAAAWLPTIRRLAPKARVIFDSVDLHFLREARQAELHGSRALRRLARRTMRRELRVVRDADATWVVSPVEEAMLRPLCPGADVRVVSNIIEADTAGLSYGERDGLLFVGSFRHPPNVDGLLWFVENVMPRLRQNLPDVVLHVAGGGMPDDLVSALSGNAAIRVHGHVPDLTPLLTGCRIGIAPLRFGAGVKGKVNSSMAHGQPVVATTCAVEGMCLHDGIDVLVADSADAFAACIVRLHSDAALWTRIAAHGRDNVRTHFSPHAAAATVFSTIGPSHARS